MGNLPEGAKPDEFTVEQIQADPILRYFSYAHLKPPFSDVSCAFASLALLIVQAVPRNPERTVSLRKLLEAKDAGVRAMVPAQEKVETDTFYDRLQDERKQLADRLDKLGVFIDGGIFQALDAGQQILLNSQHDAMEEYLRILDDRIQVIETGRATAKPADDDGIIEVRTTGGGGSVETPIPFK